MPPFVYASADFGFWDALVALSLGDEHELHGPDILPAQASGEAPLSPTDGEVEVLTPET